MESPPADAGKVRITPALIEEWTHDAGVLLDANCSQDEVIRDLRSRGCTPKMAERIVARARGPVRTAHRTLGMRTLFIGGGMVVAGWLLAGGFNHSARALELMSIGGLGVALGLFKLLTGSALDADRVMHFQEYED